VGGLDVLEVWPACVRAVHSYARGRDVEFGEAIGCAALRVCRAAANPRPGRRSWQALAIYYARLGVLDAIRERGRWLAGRKGAFTQPIMLSLDEVIGNDGETHGELIESRELPVGWEIEASGY
jgi:hypothetical protein